MNPRQFHYRQHVARSTMDFILPGDTSRFSGRLLPTRATVTAPVGTLRVVMSAEKLCTPPANSQKATLSEGALCIWEVCYGYPNALWFYKENV